MIIVIGIISSPLALLYGALERAQKFSRRTITYTELKNIESAFKQYHAHYHAWPDDTRAAKLLLPATTAASSSTRHRGAVAGQPDPGVSADDIAAFNPEMIPFIEVQRATLRPHAPR